jgi:hypothetical protein
MLFIDEENKAMETTQPAFGKIKKALKFVWRHFFTLGQFSIMFYTILFRKPYWVNMFMILGVAVSLDWVKQFIKFGSSSNPYSDPHSNHSYGDVRAPFHIRQRWDPGLIGNCAYESDNYPRIKYD